MKQAVGGSLVNFKQGCVGSVLLFNYQAPNSTHAMKVSSALFFFFSLLVKKIIVLSQPSVGTLGAEGTKFMLCIPAPKQTPHPFELLSWCGPKSKSV